MRSWIGVRSWIVFWVWSQSLNFKFLHTGTFFPLIFFCIAARTMGIESDVSLELIFFFFSLTEREQ